MSISARNPDGTIRLFVLFQSDVSRSESISLVERLTERKFNWKYSVTNRRGDHICYISDLRKIKSHFPGWRITRSLEDMVTEMVETEKARV